jgi:hypothetical protein
MRLGTNLENRPRLWAFYKAIKLFSKNNLCGGNNLEAIVRGV